MGNLLFHFELFEVNVFCFFQEPIRISSDTKRHRKSCIDTRTLTKTNVEAFNVRPRIRGHGPCTCSLDVNVSDTIRNIFEQVDVDQRKMAEHTYVKYIANKILTNSVEVRLNFPFIQLSTYLHTEYFFMFP